MNAYDTRNGRASAEQLPGLFPFWLSRYAGTPGQTSIEKLQRDLLACYERQAERLLRMASHCTDPDVRGELLDIASECIEKIEHIPREKPVQRSKTNVALIVPPRRPPQAPSGQVTKIRRAKEAEAA